MDCQAQGYLNASAVCDASGSAPVCDFVCDSGFFDANQDASDGCECAFVSSDDIPFDGLDADCDGGDGDHNDAIHVSVTNGDNAQDGSQFPPVASITQGLGARCCRREELCSCRRGNIYGKCNAARWYFCIWFNE